MSTHYSRNIKHEANKISFNGLIVYHSVINNAMYEGSCYYVLKVILPLCTSEYKLISKGLCTC